MNHNSIGHFAPNLSIDENVGRIIFANFHRVYYYRNSVCWSRLYISCSNSEKLNIFNLCRPDQSRNLDTIYSGCAGALRALTSIYDVTGLVRECLDELCELFLTSSVTLICIPSHKGLWEDEQVDKLARRLQKLTSMDQNP